MLEENNVAPVPEQPEDDSAAERIALAEGYDWLQCIVSALLICVLIFVFLFRMIGVIGSSMVPTLHEGDRVIISRLFYTPEQGDIIVLRKASFRDEPIVKRVIAVGGQTVEIDIDKGMVYVDGQVLDEPYIAERMTRLLDYEEPVEVPEGFVYVMGDNRNDSTDSRSDRIGCVDERYIMGRVLFRVLPLSVFGKVD